MNAYLLGLVDDGEEVASPRVAQLGGDGERELGVEGVWEEVCPGDSHARARLHAECREAVRPYLVQGEGRIRVLIIRIRLDSLGQRDVTPAHWNKQGT